MAHPNVGRQEDVPDFSLEGNVALVSGAATGSGPAIAVALAHADADVVLGLRQGSAEGGGAFSP